MEQEEKQNNIIDVAVDNTGENKQVIDSNMQEQKSEQNVIEETAHNIAELKGENIDNFIKIGNILYDFCHKYDTKSAYKSLLEHKDVNLKRTQANKYMDVYDYCTNKSKNCQSTGRYKILGVEKMAILNRLTDVNNIDECENLVIEKSATVKQLKIMVDWSNENQNYSSNEAYKNAIDRIEQEKIQRKEQAYSSSEAIDEYKQQQEEIMQLKEKIIELEKKLQKYESIENHTYKAEIDAVDSVIKSSIDIDKVSEPVDEDSNETKISNDSNCEHNSFNNLIIKNPKSGKELASSNCV